VSVTIEHGRIRRGRKYVLNEGSLVLPERATVGVIGANGAGKTTLFLALTGALAGRSARLRVETPWPVLRMAFMPQEPTLPGWASPAAAAELYGLALDELGTRFPGLRLHDLAAGMCRHLSGGQRQSLMLAIALGLDAPITVLDEPLSQLDLPRRYAALRTIAAHEHGLVLISSQSTADVVDCCDWYVVLREGSYAFCGPVEELLGPEWRSDPGRQQKLERQLLELTGFTVPAAT
jgi:ABC-type multidrug transport system ATPase subunit